MVYISGDSLRKYSEFSVNDIAPTSRPMKNRTFVPSAPLGELIRTTDGHLVSDTDSLVQGSLDRRQSVVDHSSGQLPLEDIQMVVSEPQTEDITPCLGDARKTVTRLKSKKVAGTCNVAPCERRKNARKKRTWIAS